MVEVEEVELLEGTLLGEEGLLEAGEVVEAAWTEVGEGEAGVSTPIFHLYPGQNGNGVDIDFEGELANLSASKPLVIALELRIGAKYLCSLETLSQVCLTWKCFQVCLTRCNS